MPQLHMCTAELRETYFFKVSSPTCSRQKPLFTTVYLRQRDGVGNQARGIVIGIFILTLKCDCSFSLIYSDLAKEITKLQKTIVF